MFQSTPAHGGRPRCRRRSSPSIRFQSTPARGGRRRSPAPITESPLVSIHARTRRATPNCCGGRLPDREFQSTPARGGRRSPRGGDRRRVSIHARTRRATPAAGTTTRASGFNPRPHAAGDRVADVAVSRALLFQSTPARGGRHYREWARHAVTWFQSTPARGGRQGSVVRTRSCKGFNPRPHAAGDPAFSPRTKPIDVSIHARTRRATLHSVTWTGASDYVAASANHPVSVIHPMNTTDGVYHIFLVDDRLHPPRTSRYFSRH